MHQQYAAAQHGGGGYQQGSAQATAASYMHQRPPCGMIQQPRPSQHVQGQGFMQQPQAQGILQQPPAGPFGHSRCLQDMHLGISRQNSRCGTLSSWTLVSTYKHSQLGRLLAANSVIEWVLKARVVSELNMLTQVSLVQVRLYYTWATFEPLYLYMCTAHYALDV